MAAKDTNLRTPRHVAIIMDGNGRWAQRRGLVRLEGHKAGADRVREIVEACPDQGVRYLTLYAFSTENWKRAPREVTGLMALFRHFIRKTKSELVNEGVRVRFIGDRSPLNAKLRSLMLDLEDATAGNGTLNLTIALNYGARDEIGRAMVQLGQDIASGRMAPKDIGTDTLRDYLDTAPLPDPDLVIRTSGETRVSNFLLWQCAYSEFEFTGTYWPDFGRVEFSEILMDFTTRERRFGAVVS